MSEVTFHPGTGKEERIDYIECYENILDAYIPGDTPAPERDKWHHRYSEYYYEAVIRKNKSQAILRSDTMPVFKGSFIGIYDKTSCEWKFYSIRDAQLAKITKYVVDVYYILLVDDEYDAKTGKHYYKIGYQKGEPRPIPSIGEWDDA